MRERELPMEHTATKPRTKPIETVREIEGRFRAITTKQLCMAWWLHREGLITRRQLRITFGLHEMHERRSYTKISEEGDRKRQPKYSIDELASLIGGSRSKTSLAALKTDVAKLGEIGLAVLGRNSIIFARTPEHLKVDDLQAFHDFWEQIPNKSRSVPVPRRTLRALAAGFSRAVTGVCLAYMIRSIHWHKREGEFRVDGRTKGSWISDVFSISRRAVTDARASLIEMGWLSPLETTQILLNRFGNHDLINVAWKASNDTAKSINAEREPASPPAEISGETASPYITESPSSKEEELNNRNSETVPVSDSRLFGDRRKRSGRIGRAKREKVPKPNLRSVDVHHLRDTGHLLDLYQQAVSERLIEQSDRGRLDFVAWAERARSRGQKPEALFIWLLRNRKFEFITQADEDAASRRIKEYHEPTVQRACAEDDNVNVVVAQTDSRTEDDRIVVTCFRAAKKAKLADPFPIASNLRGWSRKRWSEARRHYELRFGTLG